MSSINPNNINILYPIAGQDNDTQGFRNNFRSIKDNFTQAATEITSLQNSAARAPQIRYSGDIITNSVDIPISSTALGVKGQIAFDSTHLYVCTSTNNWLTLANTGDVSANTVTTGTLTSTGSRVDASFQYNAPTTNFYYTVNSNVYRFVLDPTGAITNGTVVLPVTTVNGTIIRVSSTQTVTNLQTLPGAGATLVPSANVTLTGGTCVEYLYHSTESKWYKVS